MSKRKWTDMKQYEEIILRMVSEGGTRKTIADELGLEPKQIKNFMYRYRASKKKTEPPKRRGRPRSVTPHTEKGYQKQIRQLKWKTSYSVLFFTTLEGCEARNQILRDQEIHK